MNKSLHANKTLFGKDGKPLHGWHDLHARLLVWLDANGIDTSLIPMEPAMSYADGKLTTLIRMDPGDGKALLDPMQEAGLITVTRTFDVTEPPDADIAEWLLPKCETCGR